MPASRPCSPPPPTPTPRLSAPRSSCARAGRGGPGHGRQTWRRQGAPPVDLTRARGLSVAARLYVQTGCERCRRRRGRRSCKLIMGGRDLHCGRVDDCHLAQCCQTLPMARTTCMAAGGRHSRPVWPACPCLAPLLEAFAQGLLQRPCAQGRSRSASSGRAGVGRRCRRAAPRPGRAATATRSAQEAVARSSQPRLLDCWS